MAIAGACIGFLPHNFFPARMFMGDSGAMLLGLLLATSTISLTGQIDTSALQEGPAGLVPAILPLVLPLAILALPFLDLTMAFVRRTYAGRWWFLPDKQHLHHRLLERGHSQRRAVMLMYVWSALVSFGVIVLGLVRTDRQWTVVTVIAVCALVLLLITLGRPVRHKAPGDHLGHALTFGRELALVELTQDRRCKGLKSPVVEFGPRLRVPSAQLRGSCHPASGAEPGTSGCCASFPRRSPRRTCLRSATWPRTDHE